MEISLVLGDHSVELCCFSHLLPVLSLSGMPRLSTSVVKKILQLLFLLPRGTMKYFLLHALFV